MSSLASRRRQAHRSSALISFVLGLGAAVCSAQPLELTDYQSSALAQQFIADTETSPGDDSVLRDSPGKISLKFPQRVRLVKLTLRNHQRDWVDISFRYSPQFSQSFQLPLPDLESASYYTADWAILDRRDQLVRGSFSFAFGAGAQSPSVIRSAEELLLQQRYGDPTIRYVAPPRTEIILNKEQPAIDPPFTIILQPEQGEQKNGDP